MHWSSSTGRWVNSLISEPQLRHAGGHHLGGHFLLLLGVPGLGGPDLRPVVDADDDGLLLQAGVFAQLLRDHDAALAVRLALGGVGKQAAHSLGLAHGQRGKFFGEAVPGGLGVDRQTGVHTHGQVEGGAQLLPELGGDEQPALGVDTVLVCAGHGPSPLPHLGAIFRDFTPLCSTGLFQYKACRRKKQEFFSAVFVSKTAILSKNLHFPP